MFLQGGQPSNCLDVTEKFKKCSRATDSGECVGSLRRIQDRLLQMRQAALLKLQTLKQQPSLPEPREEKIDDGEVYAKVRTANDLEECQVEIQAIDQLIN